MSGQEAAAQGPERHLVAVGPDSWRSPTLARAVIAGGGTITAIEQASGLIWSDPAAANAIGEYVQDHIRWVQLPYAGIENLVHHLDHHRLWTCGKGVYAEPVAEMVLAMALAGFRHLHGYARARTWQGPQGRNLAGARVLILGGGGIAEALLRLLAPFQTTTVVLRRNANQPVAGATVTAGVDRLHQELPQADLVVLALAATSETRGIIGATQLGLMGNHAWLINVARGQHVVTADLVAALEQGTIAGAALDVTDPEPLPPDHRLWGMDNCLITPHVGNTPEMGLELLARRVTENTRRWIAGQPLLGPVDVTRGY